ncbi:aminotransferase class V-fold PLP-dependent enzyme [Lentzea albidocapillata]|uniref:Selenocysteine lyase/Cysteine desulfurase n=1 Tax=Lentzea albidocapillata TaxID=40571 RepID=A0A1W2E2F5_9PSEU|nr:aminotransferase class V-fold PLP-dependent enzyme [Lentzea albidocapillata]SMD03943.1 Selenocysteine lyase/Cysteine desulfurase [Lentzea albidocapillata]
MREAFGAVFDVEPGYLNTASIGVPPRHVADAVAASHERWRRGQDTSSTFNEVVETSREAFGRLVGVPSASVACGATVSQFVSLVAQSLPAGSKVFVDPGDFTSVTLPFVAAGHQIVSTVEEADLVAMSVVQSADGQIADLEALRASGKPVLLDVSQAAGWRPLSLAWADFVVGVAYKWLMAPRGAAWMAVRPDRMASLKPLAANWYSTGANYGTDLVLRSDARRFDLSPTWFSHVGAAVALPWVASLDLEAVRAHCVSLTDRLLAGLGLPPNGSAIVSVARPPVQGVVSSVRAGRTRYACHMYNTIEDVDRVLEALA